MRRLLKPPGDPLDLNHYLERIDEQFDERHAQLARAVLDTLAQVDDGMRRAELIAALSTHDPEHVRAVVRYLEDDFYLRRRDADEKLRFMLELLRRFWREERGL